MSSDFPSRSRTAGDWPSLNDIQAAWARIGTEVVAAPLVESALSASTGQDVLLKLECLQPTGSFKIRGATNRIALLSFDETRRGVVTFSTGNHGRAVARAARRRGIRATVCLSSLVPEVKVAAIVATGAEIVRIGRSQDEAEVEAKRLARDEGMTLVDPIDDFDVIAGQGTVALELLEARPDLTTILVPLSGGGLISGIALAAKALKPDLRIVGISMDRGAAMARSLKAGRPTAVEEYVSLADSLGGGIGLANRFTFDICRALVEDIVLVSEQEIYEGQRRLFLEDAIVAEGASAVGYAAILAGKIRISGPTALVITGRNVDRAQFLAVASGQIVQLGEVTAGPAEASM